MSNKKQKTVTPQQIRDAAAVFLLRQFTESINSSHPSAEIVELIGVAERIVFNE